MRRKGAKESGAKTCVVIGLTSQRAVPACFIAVPSVNMMGFCVGSRTDVLVLTNGFDPEFTAAVVCSPRCEIFFVCVVFRKDNRGWRFSEETRMFFK